ncbi:MAG: TraR/DksA family transcriptional regulator [Kiritimatiellales bacterium]
MATAKKKTPARKTAAKKSIKKAAATKKTAPKKTPAKKAVAKKAPAKKPAVKRAVAKKPAAKKAPAKKIEVKKAVVSARPAPAPVPVPPVPAAPGKKKLTAKEVAMFKEMLLKLRERVFGGYNILSRDNLEANQRDPSLSDQGTDTFDREMELNMMGSEQEVLAEIDAALRRIEKGTYGICELTGKPINIERLKALPYVRYTVRAQSELEKGRAHYRPFGSTMRG